MNCFNAYLVVLLVFVFAFAWHAPLESRLQFNVTGTHNALFAEQNHTSQTVMNTRPLFQNDALICGTWAEFITSKAQRADYQAACNIVPIFSKIR